MFTAVSSASVHYRETSNRSASSKTFDKTQISILYKVASRFESSQNDQSMESKSRGKNWLVSITGFGVRKSDADVVISGRSNF